MQIVIGNWYNVLGAARGTKVATLNRQMAYRKGEYSRDELPVNKTNPALCANIVIAAAGETSGGQRVCGAGTGAGPIGRFTRSV